MLTSHTNHPDEERLSALASRDTDATADASLTGHVATCDRCTELVDELGALRASLADLPDLRPTRPLRLLPAVPDEPARVDRLGGWARRLFAPVLTAGAALALVGVVGTTAPMTTTLFQNVGTNLNDAGAPAAEVARPAEEGTPGGAGASEQAEAQPDTFAAGAPSAAPEAGDSAEREIEAPASPSMSRLSGDESEDVATQEDADAGEAMTQLPAERSPWPMVLFTGVTLIVAALLLRWILVPRAG